MTTENHSQTPINTGPQDLVAPTPSNPQGSLDDDVTAQMAEMPPSKHEKKTGFLWILAGLVLIVLGVAYLLNDPAVYQMLFGTNMPTQPRVATTATPGMPSNRAAPDDTPTPLVAKDSAADDAEFAEGRVDDIIDAPTEDELYSGMRAAVEGTIRQGEGNTEAVTMPAHDFVGALPQAQGETPSVDQLIPSSVSNQRAMTMKETAASLVNDALQAEGETISATSASSRSYTSRQSLSDMIAKAPTVRAETKEFVKIRTLKTTSEDYALRNAGRKNLSSGQVVDALSAYDQALNQNPDDALALIGRGEALQKLGRVDDAIATYMRALQVAPENHAAKTNLLGLTAQQDPQTAIETLQRMLDVSPQDHAVLGQLGTAYARQKNALKAIRFLQDAHDISPDTATYPYNLAVIHDQLGNRERAIEYYRMTLSRLAGKNDSNLNSQGIRKRIAALISQFDES